MENKEGHEATNERRLCRSRNRFGDLCKRYPSPGKKVCYYHGGAPGSGAPKGNQNATRHGLQAQPGAAAPQLRERAQAYAGREGLLEEIAIMRAKIGEAFDNEVEITSLARGTDALARLVRAEQQLKQKSGDDGVEASAQKVRGLSPDLGLTAFTE